MASLDSARGLHSHPWFVALRSTMVRSHTFFCFSRITQKLFILKKNLSPIPMIGYQIFNIPQIISEIRLVKNKKWDQCLRKKSFKIVNMNIFFNWNIFETIAVQSFWWWYKFFFVFCLVHEVCLFEVYQKHKNAEKGFTMFFLLIFVVGI